MRIWMVAICAILTFARQGHADEELPRDVRDLVAQAERELNAKPRGVWAAEHLVFKLKGAFDLSGAGRVTPQARSLAEKWQARIDAACQDPTTVYCGSYVKIVRAGPTRAGVWLNITAAPDGRTEHPVTIQLFDEHALPFPAGRDHEIRAVALNCSVLGLGFGSEAKSNKPTREFLERMHATFRQYAAEDFDFVVNCNLNEPFFGKASPEADKTSILFPGIKFDVNGRTYTTSHLWYVTEPKRLFLAMHVQPEARPQGN